MYKKVIEGITHWHEHEIHDRISAVLGYNTWEIGTARFHRGSADILDLHLEFRCREDYEKCVATIIAVCEFDSKLD